MKVNFFLLMILILWGCGPDPIPDPEAPTLIAPANLNECNTAIVLNELESQVKFEWTNALNTDSYELIIENSLTNIKLIKKTYHLNRLITLSPLTEMARKFHLSNGAVQIQVNETTQNFEYEKV